MLVFLYGNKLSSIKILIKEHARMRACVRECMCCCFCHCKLTDGYAYPPVLAFEKNQIRPDSWRGSQCRPVLRWSCGQQVLHKTTTSSHSQASSSSSIPAWSPFLTKYLKNCLGACVEAVDKPDHLVPRDCREKCSWCFHFGTHVIGPAGPFGYLEQLPLLIKPVCGSEPDGGADPVQLRAVTTLKCSCYFINMWLPIIYSCSPPRAESHLSKFWLYCRCCWC